MRESGSKAESIRWQDYYEREWKSFMSQGDLLLTDADENVMVKMELRIEKFCRTDSQKYEICLCMFHFEYFTVRKPWDLDITLEIIAFTCLIFYRKISWHYRKVLRLLHHSFDFALVTKILGCLLTGFRMKFDDGSENLEIEVTARYASALNMSSRIPELAKPKF